MTGYYNLSVADENTHTGHEKQAFPHQEEAFSALTKTFTLPIDGYKGTLLVLPTGAGKTFTAVNWICRHILSVGVRILWLAQTAYLLDQAAQAFKEEIYSANGRQEINMRVVSSSTAHANAGTIGLADDILICTIQTAISAYNAEPLDGQGNIAKTPFRRFIDNCQDSRLFIVIDEAHHVPAYGCRTLLWDSFHGSIRNLYILGLTATPAYMDKRFSGWLNVIFDKGICYEAQKEALQQQRILAVPEYIEKQTDVEFSVNDDLYDRLVHKHQDLPDKIIEFLAHNQGRNDFIISDYLKNKNMYGKTILFADRWYHCEYILKKLLEHDVKAAAVYSVVTLNDAPYQEGRGRNGNNKMNDAIMEGFKAGNYDVVVNVKMLTEGVNVPEVKTVMITRQTTSKILLEQMIGRALRGPKAGGGENKDNAYIVLFYDKWKRLLNWARPDGGGKERGKLLPTPRSPLELVSIHLVQLAAGDIEFKGFKGDIPFLTFIPVGFFGCEYTVSINDNEEMAPFIENVVVYEFNKDKYFQMIQHIKEQDLTAYAEEKLTDEDFEDYAGQLKRDFFKDEKDDFDSALTGNITKIIRHMAQNGTEPEFLDFHERSQYDLDKIAAELCMLPGPERVKCLKNIFNNNSLHWSFLYKSFKTFCDAYHKAEYKILVGGDPHPGGDGNDPPNTPVNELSEKIRQQVFARDYNICLCCGKKPHKGIRLSLQVDHIIPVTMGGKNELSNLQTLCRNCNSAKHINTIDYRAKISPLDQPKSKLTIYKPAGNDEPFNAIARIVNEFYHCAAMCELHNNKIKSGQYYYNWEIILYVGNDPAWLEPHRAELLEYVRNSLNQSHVKDVVIKN